MKRFTSYLLLCCGLLFPCSLLAHGVTTEQIQRATEMIQREPQNPQWYLRRGELYRLNGNARAALEDYARAEKLAPQLCEVNFLRARLYFDAQAPEMTELLLSQFLQQQPHHTEALLLRAQAYTRLAARQSAIADYNLAIALQAEPKPEHYLARAELQLADKRPADALAGLAEGLEKLGPLVVLQQRALEIEVQSKRWNAALTRLDALMNQSPRRESWLVQRGEILWKAGRRAEAKASFTAARAAIAQLPETLRNTPAMRSLQVRYAQYLSQ